MGIETHSLKNVIFDFLRSHQFDVSIQLIADSQMTKISLLCQLAASFTGVFGQNSQQLHIAKKVNLMTHDVSFNLVSPRSVYVILLGKCQQLGRCLANKTIKQICTTSAVSRNRI